MQSSYDTNSDKNTLSGAEAIQHILRRKWLVITIFFVGSCITLAYCFSLPPLYRSSTLILVEPQTIPPNYVRTTVTTGVQERLHTLRQQITSRTNLEHIINKFKILDELRDAAQDTPTLRLMTLVKNEAKPLLTSWGLYAEKPNQGTARAKRVTELDISRMRNNIQVQIVGRDTNRAFTVSYSGREPVTVMQITNTLSSFFIEENLKVRARIAKTTTEFLEEQLAEAEKDLNEQERALLKFKEANMGSLPSQMTANINKLDRLQLELQMITENLAAAEEKAILYEQNMLAAAPASPMLGNNNTPVDPRITQLEQLRDRLAKLRSQFNENYPDIRLLTSEIRELEANLIARATSQNSEGDNLEVDAGGPRAQWEAQLVGVRQDILTAKARRDRVRSMIDQYEKMTELTFQNEQKLAQLTRSHQTSRQNYEDLLAKRLNAKISENLEKRQKSEQFRIVDPANLPTQPYKPNRLQIIGLGCLLSLVVGAGIAFLCGQFRPSGIDKPAYLQRTFGAPVLTTIPKNTTGGAKGRLAALHEAESLIAEQYRILYTKVESRRDPSQNIFAISSAIAGEGKTITSLNLAIVMARDFGKKTLLLEGDFKRPALAPYLETELHSGIVDILGGYTHSNGHRNALPLSDVIVPFAHENLSVLPAINSVEHSTSLLSSTHMRDLLGSLKQQYDYILIDAPPVLPLSDMNIFREVVDGILFVVKANHTPIDTVARALELLETDKLLGFVLNDLQQPLPPYEYNKIKRERVLRA